MGHVLWVLYSVPLEYCKAWDQRLHHIGCSSSLLVAPLNTPSSFRLHFSRFLPNYFFPFRLCFHSWRVSSWKHSEAPRSGTWKPSTLMWKCQALCGAGGLLPSALLPPSRGAPATRGGQRLTLPCTDTAWGSGEAQLGHPPPSRAPKYLPSMTNKPPFLLLSISIHSPMHSRNKALLLIALNKCIGNPVQE